MAEEWQYAELAGQEGMVVVVEGLDELLKAFAKYPKQSDKMLKETMIHALAVPQTRAKKAGYVPVDHGVLRSSIGADAGHVFGGKPAGGILEAKKVGSEIIGRLGSKVEYAPYQEYGTQYMVGRYYLTRAVKDTKDKMVKVFEKRIAKTLKKLGL